MEKKQIAILVVVALLIIGLGVGCALYFTNGGKTDGQVVAEAPTDNVVKTEKKVTKTDESEFKIFSSSNNRPIAYMIDNNKNAQPQSNINKAFVVYEIIVEGNETRLMAIFKDIDEGKVGPIRSSRHYFLDYAMEYDAIYAHLGLSPKAGEDMASFGISAINGQFFDDGKDRHDGSIYWRDKSRKAPHNAYTSLETIPIAAKQYGYPFQTNTGTPLKYSHEEVKLDQEGSFEAAQVSIPYGGGHVVKYVYNEETGRYTRYSKGVKQTDRETGEDATTKNLIITFAKNFNLPDTENKGRQDVITTGTLDGYYLTNGRAIKIKCTKDTRRSQTKYTDLNGNEIKINDGNTWINVCPIDADVTF